jgi:hypothetical protein
MRELSGGDRSSTKLKIPTSRIPLAQRVPPMAQQPAPSTKDAIENARKGIDGPPSPLLARIRAAIAYKDRFLYEHALQLQIIIEKRLETRKSPNKR